MTKAQLYKIAGSVYRQMGESIKESLNMRYIHNYDEKEARILYAMLNEFENMTRLFNEQFKEQNNE